MLRVIGGPTVGLVSSQASGLFVVAYSFERPL